MSREEKRQRSLVSSALLGSDQDTTGCGRTKICGCVRGKKFVLTGVKIEVFLELKVNMVQLYHHFATCSLLSGSEVATGQGYCWRNSARPRANNGDSSDRATGAGHEEAKGRQGK